MVSVEEAKTCVSVCDPRRMGTRHALQVDVRRDQNFTYWTRSHPVSDKTCLRRRPPPPSEGTKSRTPRRGIGPHRGSVSVGPDHKSQRKFEIDRARPRSRREAFLTAAAPSSDRFVSNHEADGNSNNFIALQRKKDGESNTSRTSGPPSSPFSQRRPLPPASQPHKKQHQHGTIIKTTKTTGMCYSRATDSAKRSAARYA